MVKPDAVRYVGSILERILEAGFLIGQAHSHTCSRIAVIMHSILMYEAECFGVAESSNTHGSNACRLRAVITVDRKYNVLQGAADV